MSDKRAYDNARYGKDQPPPTPLTVDSIKDFQTCALLYEFRHVKGDYEPITGRELMYRRFENKMKLVASFFFYKKQSGNVPSYAALLNRWEKLWFPKEMSAYDIAVEQHESAYGNYASFSNDASKALMRFYDDFVADNSDAIMIDEEFMVPLSNSRLTGTFDLVLRDAKTKRYKVVKWISRYRKPPLSSLLVEFAALRHAFEYRNEGKDLDVTYGYYDLASPGKGFTSIGVTQDDINALTYWARTIEETDLFVPRRGLTAYCKKCPFDHPCSQWKEWPSD